MRSSSMENTPAHEAPIGRSVGQLTETLAYAMHYGEVKRDDQVSVIIGRFEGADVYDLWVGDNYVTSWRQKREQQT